MARVTEVGRTEAEEDGHRTAVAAFVLQEICAVFWTHLKWGKEEKAVSETNLPRALSIQSQNKVLCFLYYP